MEIQVTLARITLFALSCLFTQASWSGALAQESGWKRFTIDDSMRGADGARLADANRDGLLDIVTGWEESGETRAYLHPGPARVHEPWPSVVVGSAPSVEDAIWVDLNLDGQLDVLSSCEGKEQSLRMHLAPMDRANLLDREAWTTTVVPVSRHMTRWMFATPLPTSPQSKSQIEIVVGSKSPNGMIGVLTHNGDDWQIEKLTDASWIMSILIHDVDRDGDSDILYSDRKGSASGVYWLENQSHQPGRQTWSKHAIGALGHEVMFMVLVPGSTVPSSSSPGLTLFAAVKPNHVFRLAQTAEFHNPWEETVIELPPEQLGTAKSVAAHDLDGDGFREFVFSCESASESKQGVVYFRQNRQTQTWRMHSVSGAEGIKFDLLQVLDLDGDGDLDILTCEERAGGRGLGVIWYSNPLGN